MRILILLAVFSLMYSCKSVKKENIPKKRKYSEINNILPEKFYLANRIKDCQNAISFMKAVIEPDTNETKLFYIQDKFYPIGNINFSITGDKNINKLKNIVRFYINLECLEILDYKELFSILCSEKDFNIIDKEFNSDKGKKRRYIFEVSVKNMDGFSIIVKNLKIIEINWDVHKILY
ncbi:MAG TPA: hypothetical protein ENK91_16585 [Bacteroidetes bacterium]|nr:hypothetical protein [Bacteroidota bacterium]